MRKILPIILAFMFASCSISKTTSRFVTSKAQEGKLVAHDKYVSDKIEICKYLALTEEQSSKLAKLFDEEKRELDKIDKDDQQMLARNIYKYENEFRNTLNKEQLKMYKKMRPQFEDKYFYSQHSLNSIRNSIMSI